VHKRNPIVNLPLLIGSVLSIAIHVGALYGKGIYTPPKPLTEQGRTVVLLTLLPSVASQAAAPEPQAEKPVEEPVELRVEQASLPVLPAKPATEALTTPEPKTVAEAASVNSLEREASLVEEKGVTAEAQTFKAILPAYPRISQRLGEEGTVTLSIDVLANGSAGNVSVIQSSGYRRLDTAAIKAARATAFTPARQFGRNIDSTTELSFTFRLTDD
jgi:protein TonB